MAKIVVPKQQQPQQPRKAGGKSDAAARPFSLNLSTDWLFDDRLELAVGVLTVILSICMLIAFCSYAITGVADQSVAHNETAFNTPYQRYYNETQNPLGLVGAVVAHYFIFRWFGLAALALPILLFLAGIKIAFKKELLPLARLTKGVLFYVCWLSLLMGYFVLATGSETQLSHLSGGLGYEINAILYPKLGIACLLLVLFVWFLFLVYYHNVRSFDAVLGWLEGARTRPAEHSDEQEVDLFGDELQPLKKREFKEHHEDEIIDKNQLDIELNANEPTLAVEPIAKNLTPNGTVKNQTPKETGKLTLTIETPEPEEPQEPAIQIIEPTFYETQTKAEDLVIEHGLYDPLLDLPKYQMPNIGLLIDYPEKSQEKMSPLDLELNKDKIVETLGNYGIGIASIKATIGPTVTLYEIIPEAGVRISKIKNLEDDIALNLAALGIRIIAPIPGKGTIGIEVPNKNRERVSARSVLTSEKFQKANYELPIVLGKTISNEIYVADLAKMPHLLMAGATGQGKSVGINILLTSLLYRKHPSQLKLILVDPKKVELTLYNKLERHFLAKLPNSDEAIITDTKKVVNTLNSLCIEMDNRYKLLQEAGCRNIMEYNEKFVKRKLNPEKGHRFLPYIVLVIDELADLMMTAGKEVEQPIARLAQLARAIGIHLVVATQRPSVNVITGLIKANFPARLSFKVTSKIDSRTILDTGGAEQLVGMGDMLLSTGSDMIRLQCPFVDTPEVEDICEFVGAQHGYDSAYFLPEFEGDEGGEERGDVDLAHRDAMFDEAARLIVLHQQGSTSLIQRRMKLGYNRSGRIMDQLEAAGVVGAFTGSKARDVLIGDLESLEILLKSL